MKYPVSKPCKECPFVLNRTKGYIGGYKSASELHEFASSETEFECHLTMTNEDDNHQHCRGIQLYRKGICKRPRNSASAKHQDAVVAEFKDSDPAVPAFKLKDYHGT